MMNDDDVTQEPKAQEIAEVLYFLQFGIHGNTCHELHLTVRRMAFLIDRLKAGKFTDQELQNLCHNLGENDYKAFCDGCDEYQKKLFGKCRSDGLRQTLNFLCGDSL